MEQSRRVIYLDSVDSTNSFARREGLKTGTIVYTFRQTAGRGRLGRSWHEVEEKNLALSAVFAAREGESPFWRIALLSLPMAGLLRTLAVGEVWIKWPNDIMAGGKKIAGVLAEMVMEKSQIVKIIAGIGINLNATPAELSSIPKPATSLLCETGRWQDPGRFAGEYIARLSGIMEAEPPVKAVRERWLAESGMIGRMVECSSPTGPVRGRAVDVDEEGLLHLETDGGIVKAVAGDLGLC